MSNYSFVLIFTFILAITHYVLAFIGDSIGKPIECYKCKHDTRSPDPNCVNVNEKTTKESGADFFSLTEGHGYAKCLYTRKPEKAGAYAIERKLVFLPDSHVLMDSLYCRRIREENLGGECKLCDTNLCNSMSGGPAPPPPRHHQGQNRLKLQFQILTTSAIQG